MLNFFKRSREKLPDRSISDLKNITNILFIDDKVFGNVDIIKNAGWKNTRQIKDVDSIDQFEIEQAHILFIDIQGVGKKLKFMEEGLGLIKAIKTRYPNKKVIVYSSEDQGKIEAFHPSIDIADSRLPKNADPYQFQVLIENYSTQVFGLSECIIRIEKILLDEFGSVYPREDIKSNLEKLYRGKKYDLAAVNKIFNINNGGSVAEIVSLFFGS